MKQVSLIANSGIQVFTLEVQLNFQDKFKQWYHEWYDTEENQWKLSHVLQINDEDETFYYDKQKLHRGGYLQGPLSDLTFQELREDGIMPLRVDDINAEGVKGEIYSLTFSDRKNKLSCFENVWLPLPYFFKRTEKKFHFGPFNWARCKFVPKQDENGVKSYDVVLAFDTRARYEVLRDKYDEYPVFPDQFKTSMDFELCSNEFSVMEFCSADTEWGYVHERLFQLCYPELQNVGQIKGNNVQRLSFVASYIFLMQYLTQHEAFPRVTLYKDVEVEVKDVDMVVDIGNSRTTALLIEDNRNFNQVRQLELTDYTDLFVHTDDGLVVNRYQESFDMRLAFRKVDFGQFGFRDSRQFVYPSLVRLGREAEHLIHRATNSLDNEETLSTYSSPKRYLWDDKPSKEEWKYLILPGEKDDHVLYLRGITNQLKSDGRVDAEGNGGHSFHYSRRSLMTLAFLEMLVQAHTQLNGEKHRSSRYGLGRPDMPRRVKRIIVTCPTAMSRVEREALVKCAKDAVTLLDNFQYNQATDGPRPERKVEVIPAMRKKNDEEGGTWYYDEATCAQLVYMYGEVGHKYKGHCSEFFKLYGKIEPGSMQHSLTVGSLDIGAGTTDLMISRYTYDRGDVTTITPDPLFYDSFYQAGDDMLFDLIKSVMIKGEHGAFRRSLAHLDSQKFNQVMKNFFGHDYNGQTVADRMVRKEFNIQYSVPLMTYFLQLLSQGSEQREVSYLDVFAECPPSEALIYEFKERTGIDVTQLTWTFNPLQLNEEIQKSFEPLLRKLAVIFFAHACDVILLSGRPASLQIIRDILLKYYPVSPDRLIVLNNYYVGDWYPFGDNTGYIRNAKTVVSMGGVIGHYAAEISNLNKFIIDLSCLKERLTSTVNYIESMKEGEPVHYFITPNANTGDVTVSNIPCTFLVRQLELETYPSRPLYALDYDYTKIGERIRKKCISSGQELPTDAQLREWVKLQVDEVRKRLPLRITLERDPDDKEHMSISSIVDHAGNEVREGLLEIHLQSMGCQEQYWLDSGAFDF